MREIKFRQPVTKNNIFQDWHYWGYITNSLDSFTTPLSSNDGEIKRSYQFTGLKDKNGKDIYEGDIVDCWAGLTEKNEGYLRTVVWKESGLTFEPGTGFTLCERNSVNLFEVIGNIYENPELLTN